MLSLAFSRRGAGLAVMAVLLVALGGGYFRDELLDALNLRQGVTETGELDALRTARRDLADSLAKVRGLARAQRTPARVLDQVSRLLPDRVWLDRLRLRKKKVTISGRSSDTYGVADFLESLGATPGFTEPETESITKSKGEYRYALSFSIDPAALHAEALEGGSSPEQPAASGHPAASGEQLKAEIGQLEMQLDRLLPDAKQTDDLLRGIRTLALKHGVVLVKFRPREVIDGDVYRRWPIDVSLEAPYHGLVSFLDQIGGIGRIVVPRDLDVVASRGGSGVTATLILTAYLKEQGESSSSPPGRRR